MNGNNIEIQQLIVCDENNDLVQKLVELQRLLYGRPDTRTGKSGEPFLHKIYSANALKNMQIGGNQCLLLALQGTEIVGFLQAFWGSFGVLTDDDEYQDALTLVEKPFVYINPVNEVHTIPTGIGWVSFIHSKIGIREGDEALLLNVEARFHGQGIGTALMKHYFILCQQRGIKVTYAEIAKEPIPNSNSAHFFRKFGAQATGENSSASLRVYDESQPESFRLQCSWTVYQIPTPEILVEG